MKSASPSPVALPAGGGCAPRIEYTVTSNYNPMGMAYDVSRNRLFVANRDGPDDGSLMMVYWDWDYHTYLPLVSNAYPGMLAGAGSLAAGAPAHIMGGVSPKFKYLTGLPGVQGVAFDSTRDQVYAVGGGKLYIVDGTTLTLADTFTLGTNFQAFAVAYNPTADKIYVTDYVNDKIKIISAQTWAVTNVDTSDYRVSEPGHMAVNSVTNKVYVANHDGGSPYGFVNVISGLTNQIVTNIGLSADVYGIAVDTANNRIFVTSISEAKVSGIDGATNDLLVPNYYRLVHAANNTKVPLRMVGVNPNVDSTLHLWLTSSSGDTGDDLEAMDRVILMAGDWSAMGAPQAVPVGQFPQDGLIVDPATWKIFVSNSGANELTALDDNTTLCLSPLRSVSDEPIVLVAGNN